MSNDLTVKIGVDSSGVDAGMAAVREAITKSTEQIKRQLETVTKGFETITGSIKAVTAALAGGAIFKEIIESTKSWGEGNIQLARALGITSERATAYQVALQHLGIDNDVLVGASLALSKQIYSNGAAFEKAGIATKESNGSFRAVGDVLQDVTNYLNRIHDPIERNIAGMQLLGKRYGEFRSLLKLSSDQMGEAAERAKQLGLATNKEQIERYNFAMRDTALVVTALQNQLGKALLPVLTQIGVVFAERGPRTAEIFATGLKMVAYVAETVSIEMEKLGLWVGKLAAQVNAFVHGDFKAIHEIQREFNDDLTRLNKSADELWDKLNRPVPKQAAEPEEADPGPHDFESKQKDEPRTRDWETALNEKKAAFEKEALDEGQIREFSKQQEIEYWLTILNTTRTTLEERKQVRAKIAADEVVIERQAIEGKLAALKTEENAAGTNLQKRLQAEMDYAAQIKATYADQPKLYEEAQRQILRTQQEIIEQSRKVAEVQIEMARSIKEESISNAEADAQEQYALRRITLSELIALQEKYQQEKYQLELKARADELANVDPNTDPVAYAQKLAQIQKLAMGNEATMLKIARQANQQQIALAKNLESTLANGMSNAFNSILKGTATVGQAFKGMMQGMLESVVQSVAKIIAQWVAQHAIALLLNKSQALSNAGTAATGAMASAAAIPYIGWLLAPIEGAAVYAGALAFAERGYDIPAGLNPMVQAHESEMILPKEQANVIRDMAGGGGGGGGGGGATYHINANDSRSFAKSLKRGGTLEKTMREMHRRAMKR